MQSKNLEYKSFKYTPEYEVEADGDNAKIWHEITTPEGKRESADFTPYSYMTQEDFELYIDLNMPDRITRNGCSGPLNTKDLKELSEMRQFENFISNQP